MLKAGRVHRAAGASQRLTRKALEAESHQELPWYN